MNDKIAEESLSDMVRPVVMTAKSKKGVRLIIGSVHGVNDEGALLTDFKPTRYELEVLADHYIEIIKSINAVFDMGQSGSYEIRMLPFASKRLERIEKHLGKDAVKEIAKKIYYCQNCENYWNSICEECKWSADDAKPSKFEKIKRSDELCRK